jgi:predicted PurR-regulated permease PerM
MSVSTTNWQRAALIGVCATAIVIVGACLWMVVGYLAQVLGLFFGGWLIACLQEPLVEAVRRRARMPRATAVIVTYAVVLVAVTGVWLVASPAVSRQVSTGMEDFPSQVDAASRRAVAGQAVVNEWLAEHDSPRFLDVEALPGPPELVGKLVRTSSPQVVASGALSALGNLGLMLLLSVFFLFGGPQLADQLVEFAGHRAAPDLRYVLCAVHDAFESFARTQLVQAVMFSAGVWACLTVAQVSVAPVVAPISGVLLIVPVVGAPLAVALPVLSAVLGSPNAGAALGVGAALVLWEQVVLNVIGPRLMSRQLGLPPLLVLFGVLAGGQIAGFWGALFGIPVLAALVTCLTYFRPRWGD